MISRSMSVPVLRDNVIRFARHTTLCFILFSLILTLGHERAARIPDLWHIHAGILRDVSAELPIGRQALVSSLAVLPLTNLAALPFLPWLNPPAFGFAYLYGLALLLALAAMPLAALLGRWGLGRVRPAAPLVLALAAWLLGSTEWSDGLACLAMLMVALYFETGELPEWRALSGVFWALVLFAHLAGWFLVVIRVSVVVINRVRGRCSREARAVQGIQGVSVLYGLGVYLFLNGMIMGTPAYPFGAASGRFSVRNTDASKRQLALILGRHYSDCRPVVSGLWGYAIQPLLAETEGYHVVDFHPRKLPPDETGSLVLVIPAPGNPFAPLNDLKPAAITMSSDFAAPPAFDSTPEWTFIRIDMKTVESE